MKKPKKKRTPSHVGSSTLPIKSSPRNRHKPLRPSDDLRERVKKSILFTNVRLKTVAATIKKLTVRNYKAGDLIFDQSTRGRDIYLIIRGKVRIKKYTKQGLEFTLALLRENDFFGELSIIDGLPRSARVEAAEHSSIAILKGDDFRNLVHVSDAFALNVMKKLSISLRAMDQAFVRELEQNERAAKTKMDRSNLLIEASRTVNSTIDLDELLKRILKAATDSLHADRGTLYLVDEAAGEIWSKIMQGKTIVEIRLPMGKGLAGYVAKTGETINITDAYKDPRFNPEIDKKSGYQTHTVLCMPMRDKEGKIVGVFQLLNKSGGIFTTEDEAFIDALSVHAAIALENARIAQQMVQSERLSAVGRMASTIIHDIKNPMGTLRLYAQVIKKKTENEEAAQMAEEIIHQVDRFVNMTQEILDFSRGISEINLQQVHLGQLMEGALKFIEQDLIKKKITLVRQLDYIGMCTLDVEKMVRVFYNLASNAADAMPHGGSLTVVTQQENNHLELSFADTGTGIPEEIRTKIFEPFATFGKKHGTGLGLAIVKKIVDDHKGNIEVESEVNKGTTFRLRIPID